MTKSATQKYRKKPVIIEAVQWWFGDGHPAVQAVDDGSISDTCKHCGKDYRTHGWIQTLEGGHIVCPGDWIITGIKGEHYPCKPDIFEASYEPV